MGLLSSRQPSRDAPRSDFICYKIFFLLACLFFETGFLLGAQAILGSTDQSSFKLTDFRLPLPPECASMPNIKTLFF